MDVIAESMMGYMKFNLISIGMKNNIFENMAQPISCKELAEKCGCDERLIDQKNRVLVKIRIETI